MSKNLLGINNRKTNFTTIAAMLMVVAIFVSCSSSEIAESKDVNQKTIYQTYSVSYDASAKDTYYVWAQFRFGGNKGTTLKLSEPSNVTVNGTKMDERQSDFYGCSYETSISSTNKFTFTFTDTEKIKYINSISVNSVKPKEIKSFNVDKDFVLYWKGSKLEKNEQMTAYIEDSEGNRAEVNTDIIGTDYVILKPEDMQFLVAGNGQIYFVRSASFSTQQSADEGGNIYYEYNSEKAPVLIIKTKTSQTNTK